MNRILEVNNLSFSYHNQGVINELKFSLESGDFLGIIGSNGAGKSTLMKLILGLLPYKNGEIHLFGEERRTFKDLHKLGYVSQKATSFNSSFPATVAEVVISNMCAEVGLFRRPCKAHIKRVNQVLEEVGMDGYQNRLIGKLSGGQQQKVFIARSLISNPQLLLLDEPTVGVDAKSVESITELISGLNKQGMTIIMTNHDTPSLVALANKLLIMANDGTATLYKKSELSALQLERICGGKDGHHHA